MLSLKTYPLIPQPMLSRSFTITNPTPEVSDTTGQHEEPSNNPQVNVKEVFDASAPAKEDTNPTKDSTALVTEEGT